MDVSKNNIYVYLYITYYFFLINYDIFLYLLLLKHLYDFINLEIIARLKLHVNVCDFYS